MTAFLLFLRSPLAKYGIVIALVLGSLYAIYHKGYNEGEADTKVKWMAENEAKRVAIEKVIKSVKALQEQVNIRTEIQYVEKVKVITKKGETIYEKIPEIITVKDDSACKLNIGTIRLLDFAAESDSHNTTLPDTTDPTNADPAAATISDVAKSVTSNYQTYHQVAAQLTSLQEWIKAQQQQTK
jgi:hypothetical protein